MIMEVKMRKVFFLLGILIVITGFSFSQTLTITNPSGAVTWSLNTTHLIQWTYGGAGNIMIQLYQSGSPVGTVYNGANSGSFSWTIDKYLNGNPIATGNYKLRVRSKNNSSIYAEIDLTIVNSGGIFSQKHLIKFKIPITSPKSGETYFEGNNVNIVWNNALTKGKTVNISAAYGQNHHYHLFTLTCDKTAKHQMIGWRIPKDFIKEHNIKRKRYRIYIECQINSRVFKGLSEEFTIKKRSGESQKLFPSCVNQVKQYSDYSECGQFIKQITPYPTNAHNIVVAGFHGWYESYHCRNAYVYRGKAYFDLVSFRKFHKYLYNGGYRFQKATLKIINTNKKCPLIIHVIKNDNSDLFKVQLGDKVNHNGSKADITSVVRKWLIFPSKNKGLLFIGNDEKGLYNNYNDPCVMQVQLTLTLEFIRL